MLPEKAGNNAIIRSNNFLTGLKEKPFKETYENASILEEISRYRESYISFARSLLNDNVSLLPIVQGLMNACHITEDQMPNNLLLRVSQLQMEQRYKRASDRAIVEEHNFPKVRRGMKTYYSILDNSYLSVIAPIPNPANLDEVVEPNRTYYENGDSVPRLWEMDLEIDKNGEISLTTDSRNYAAGQEMGRSGFFTGSRSSRIATAEETAGFEQLLNAISKQDAASPRRDQKQLE